MPFYCQGLSVNEKSKTMILLFAEKLSTSFYRMNGRNAFSVVKGFYHYTRKLKKWFALGTKNVDIRLRDEWPECLISCQRAASVTMLLLLVKRLWHSFQRYDFWTEWMNCWYDRTEISIDSATHEKDETSKRFCSQRIEWICFVLYNVIKQKLWYYLWICKYIYHPLRQAWRHLGCEEPSVCFSDQLFQFLER